MSKEIRPVHLKPFATKFGPETKIFADQQERNQAALELLNEWENDTSGCEEDNAEAIERALAMAETEPLILREPSIK